MTNDIIIIHSNSMYWIKLPRTRRELNLSLVTFIVDISSGDKDNETIEIHLTNQRFIIAEKDEAELILNEIENYRNQLLNTGIEKCK